MQSALPRATDLYKWTETQRPRRHEREAEEALAKIHETHNDLIGQITDVMLERAKAGYPSASIAIPKGDAALAENLRKAFLYRGFITNDKIHMGVYGRFNVAWADDDPEL